MHATCRQLNCQEPFERYASRWSRRTTPAIPFSSGRNR